MRVSVFLTCLVALRTATAAQQLDLHTVDGKLWLPVFTEQNIKTSKIKLLLSVNGGSQLQSFPKVDGSFTFYAVPSGTHMLDVVSLELVFPQVRIDVDASTGRVTQSYANNPMQKRPPLNLQSMIMSPYGLMIGFMIFALSVMPMLKVDPSKYKEFMGEKGQDKNAVAGGSDAASSTVQRLQQ